MRVADDAAEFPDQRHDGVAGAGETLVDAGAVHLVQPGSRDDGGRCFLGDNAKIGLGAGERGLHVQPGLPAVFQAIQRADAGVGDARSGG